MVTQKLERRAILGRAVLAGTGALLALGPVNTLAHDGGDSIAGAWMIDVTAKGGAPSHKVMNLYTVDGGVVGSSSDPPSSGSAAYGAWERSGRRQFQITFVGFTFGPAGDANGTLKVQARASLNIDGKEINGPARVTLSALDGTKIFALETTFRGTRIRVEPLQ
jgi:hypothetical protein